MYIFHAKTRLCNITKEKYSQYLSALLFYHINMNKTTENCSKMYNLTKCIN